MTGPPADPFPELPVDPDVPGDPDGPGGSEGSDGPGTRLRTSRARPTHLRPGLIGLVLAGGAAGAPVRYAISQLWTTPTGGFPWSTFTINVSGAFALGLLLEVLGRAGADTGHRRALRLLLGTGVLGAFTTYSTLAVEADLLVRAHRDDLAASYAVGSLAAGLIACLAGILVGGAGHRAVTRSPTPAATDRHRVRDSHPDPATQPAGDPDSDPPSVEES